MFPSSQRRKPSFDLRSAFHSLSAFAAQSEGEEEEDDKQEVDEGDGDDPDGTSGESGSGDDVKDPEKKRLSEEAARHRVKAKALEKELEELKQWRKEQEDAKKSNEERLEGALKEATDKIASMQDTLKSQAVRLAFFESGEAAKFKSPSAALKLMDLDGIEPDDEGSVDTKEIAKRAEELLKKEPYLGKQDGDDRTSNDNTLPNSGRPTNRKPTKDERNRAELEKKFPALQGR